MLRDEEGRKQWVVCILSLQSLPTSTSVCLCWLDLLPLLIAERINRHQEALSSRKSVEEGDVLRDMFYSPTSQFIFTSALP